MGKNINYYISRCTGILRGNLVKFRFQSRGKNLKVLGKLNITRHYRGSTLEIGDNVTLYQGVSFFLDSEESKIKIGDQTYINRRTEIMAKKGVEIGDNCAISWDVTITDTDYHSINNKIESKPIVIGNNVWIGCKTTILKGVIIGEGAVIASNSLVNRDVPPNTLVGGVPARVLINDIKWK